MHLSAIQFPFASKDDAGHERPPVPLYEFITPLRLLTNRRAYFLDIWKFCVLGDAKIDLHTYSSYNMICKPIKLKSFWPIN